MAAVILLSISACVHTTPEVRPIYEAVGGLIYLTSEAWQVFLLVP